MKKLKTLQSLVKTIEDPPKSSVYLKTLTKFLLGSKDNLSNQMVQEFLEQHPKSNQKILNLINHSFFSFQRDIVSAYQAFLYLGLFRFYQLALLTEIFHIFEYRQILIDDFDKKGFWTHSFSCGIACKEIAQHMMFYDIHQAFIAGVLHDIGKICWRKYFNPYLKEIISLVRQNDILMIDAEREFLNVTHCELGDWFLKTLGVISCWNPSILYHHDPERYMDTDPLVAIVHVADILARALCIGDPGDEKIPVMSPKAFRFCQLTPGYLEFILEKITLEIPSIDIYLQKI